MSSGQVMRAGQFSESYTIIRKLAEVGGVVLKLASTPTGHVILSARKGEPPEVLYVLGWQVDVAEACRTCVALERSFGSAPPVTNANGAPRPLRPASGELQKRYKPPSRKVVIIGSED